MGYALSGKTALVTGANRGIGEARVDALVAAGVKKVYAAARNVSTLDPLVNRHGSRVVPLQLDVTNAAQIAATAATATDVDLLVNNAGIVGFFGGEFTDRYGSADRVHLASSSASGERSRRQHIRAMPCLPITCLHRCPRKELLRSDQASGARPRRH